MKGLKRALAVVSLCIVVLLAFYFAQTSDNRPEAGTNQDSFEAAGEGVTATDNNKTVSTVMQVQTVQTEKETTEITTTIVATENIITDTHEIQQTKQATAESSIQDKPTEASLQQASQSPIQTETEAQASKTPVKSEDIYTNIVYKDAYNTYQYSNLDDAQKNISIPALTDDQAKAEGIKNKSKYAKEAEMVITLINDYRASLGLSRLIYNDSLATAAMHRAAESAYSNWNMTAIENGNSKRHIRPNYQKASTIFSYYGLTGNFGENYGRFQPSPDEILKGWKESKSHNELMTSAVYSQIGVGVAQDSDGYYYWIALFM